MMNLFINIYLPRLFDWVIETSIMASIVVGFILCVKIVLRNKLTPRWQYVLWMILIVRLVLPWSPDSSYSIYSILSYNSGTEAIFHQKESMNENVVVDDTNVSGNENNYAPSFIKIAEENEIGKQQNKNEATFSFYTIFLYIWLAGVIILGIATVVMNRRLHRYMKKQPAITDERIVKIFEDCKKSMSVQQNIPLLLAGKISSPTVFGFFHPMVLLSSVHMKVLDEQQLKYVFYHELAHIKRRDVGVNWLMHSLLILNWFNPILWYAYSCMREDQELACDAFALTFIDSEEQIAYGHTIITLLEHYASYYQTPSLANLSRNKRTLKRRIRMIKNFQKKSYRLSALGVIVVIAVSSVSLLNARADVPTKQKKEQTVVEKKEQPGVLIGKSVERTIGTKEQALAELKIPESQYEKMMDETAAAKKYLTKDEFDTYITLQGEWYALQKKAIALGGDPERLSAEEQNKIEKIAEELGPLWEKVRKHFIFTKEEARKIVDFPIEKPTYVAEGYQLTKERVDTEVTIGKPNPIINSEYRGEEFGYTIYQSAVLEKGKDPFYFWINDNDKMENYELEGTKVTFAKMTGSNVKAMKMIVPATGKQSAYQVVIVDDVLNKAELEKIMLSMLK
ncbi:MULTISPECIES: M56 family metallopeptidase [Bacillus cereus group]|uniref:M56 family metallopeptidase n=1 Tax=Bacillus cereus group TaxID=86661 RepID=UPI000BF8E47C|nr:MULTISPECIES: M56 family metallopeptidase [Bacillus cereus group]PFR27672.1 transcriptional regulator [Bacillus cereus]